MLVYFGVETFTENNGVDGLPSRRSLSRFSSVEPELHAIKEVNPTPVEDGAGGSLAISAEEDARRKDALETLDDAAVVKTVFGQLNKIEYLSGGTKMNLAALLPDSQRSSPKWDQPILTKGQSIVGMGDQLKRKFAVASGIGKFSLLWSTQGHSAQNERPGMECQFLRSALTLFPNELNQFQLLKSAFRYAESREDFAGRNERGSDW